MKTKAKTIPGRTSHRKTVVKTPPKEPTPSRTVPRCAKCGAKTVRLEQLNQELLAVLTIHCLICGHHTFVGKPMVRLIRRPEIPQKTILNKVPTQT